MILPSCSTHRDVVQEGRFQKRTHQGGWHIDLHRSGDHDRGASAHLHRVKPRLEAAPLALKDPHERLLASKDRTEMVLPRPSQLVQRKWEPAWVRVKTPMIVQPLASNEQDGDENVVPRKKWNRLAVPTLVSAVSIIALAIFTTSTTAVILAAITTLVLGGISLRQIRRREEAGKGFALVGLILGLIATLITAMAIAVVGFV